jgi:hypothetical protein
MNDDGRHVASTSRASCEFGTTIKCTAQDEGDKIDLQCLLPGIVLTTALFVLRSVDQSPLLRVQYTVQFAAMGIVPLIDIWTSCVVLQ